MISVIIPTFNRGRIISRAIDSVLAQTYQNYEVIVIDDGSTDNTQKTLEKYQDKIRYFRQDNQGVSSARNVGIKNAQGAFINFLDSDDILYPEKFQKQISYLRMHPFKDIVYGGWKEFDKDKNHLITEFIPDPKTDILKKLIWEGYAFPIHSALVRKKCFTEQCKFDETLQVCEDKDLWMKMALSKFTFGCIGTYVCEYLYSTDSASKNLQLILDTNQVLIKRVFSDSRLPKRIRDYKIEREALQHLDKAIMAYSETYPDQDSLFHEIKKHLFEAEKKDSRILLKSPVFEAAFVHKAIENNLETAQEYIQANLDKLIPQSRYQKRIIKKIYARLFINQAFYFSKIKKHKNVIQHCIQGIYFDPSWIKNKGVLSILISSIRHRAD